MTKTVKMWLAALGALLVVVVILLIVVIGQNNASSEQDEIDRVNAICEDEFTDPYGDDLDAFIACQEDLLSR